MNVHNKIILFATTDLNFDQRVAKVSSSLYHAGYDVLVIGRTLKKSQALITRPYHQIRINCWFEKGIWFYLEFNLRIIFFLMFNKAAVLVANDLDTISGVYLGSLFQNKPKLVFDAHEYFTQVPELINRKFKQKIWQWIEYIFVPKMDLCYTVNESLAHIFKQNLTIDFQVIQNCPEYRELASSENTATEKYILYQGALNKGRGLEQLIAAMQNVAIKLKIAGDGDLAAQLKKQVKALELEKKVQFLGNLKYDELQLITQNAWIGVNLLENESLNYFYSLANKFFDYAHAEIPQIGMQFPEYIRLNNA